MTVKEIIGNYLKQTGYSGLCSDDCGCGLDDIAPCDGNPLDCEPAYNNPCRAKYEGCDNWYQPEKFDEADCCSCDPDFEICPVKQNIIVEIAKQIPCQKPCEKIAKADSALGRHVCFTCRGDKLRNIAKIISQGDPKRIDNLVEGK